MKEKQLYLVEKKKAESLLEKYVKAKETDDKWNEVLACFVNMGASDGKVIHKKYGVGLIDSIDSQYVVATYPEKQAKISLPVGIANDIIRFDSPEFDVCAEKYRDVLKKYDSIPRLLEYAAKALKPYEEHLE